MAAPPKSAAALLAVTIALEVFATTSMKLAERSALWYIGVFGGYTACFSIFPLVLRSIPLGVAYAIWSGCLHKPRRRLALQGGHDHPQTLVDRADHRRCRRPKSWLSARPARVAETRQASACAPQRTPRRGRRARTASGLVRPRPAAELTFACRHTRDCALVDLAERPTAGHWRATKVTIRNT
eukprot:7220813-Prymnesium_polylepis.1